LAWGCGTSGFGIRHCELVDDWGKAGFIPVAALDLTTPATALTLIAKIILILIMGRERDINF